MINNNIELKKYGLIGYPIGHSFSPSYFRSKFEKESISDSEYLAYPIASIEGLSSILNNGLDGFNITIPYKEDVISFVDELSDDAEMIGAVNTVHIVNGKLIGHNTDIYGFEHSLSPLLQNDVEYRALILGTGGASKAVEFVLKKLNIPYLLVSRNVNKLNYRDLNEEIIQSHQIIINTTPIGMAPNQNKKPSLPYKFISEKHILFDLIYNPQKTLFLKEGEKQGATIKNGEQMLELQAEKSWDIWRNS